jgi:acyl-coenzyme A thioesterase PaaI-like protein
VSESFTSKFIRWGFNLFPAYCATGARITFISHDFREVTVRLPLSWQTRNVVGTIFGGSMYAAVDPVYMLMLIRNLGPDYIVWDRSACIDFKKPGRSALFARFRIDGVEIDTIKRELENVRHVDRVYHVDLVDQSGTVHASIEKVVYVRKRERIRTDR